MGSFNSDEACQESGPGALVAITLAAAQGNPRELNVTLNPVNPRDLSKNRVNSVTPIDGLLAPFGHPLCSMFLDGNCRVCGSKCVGLLRFKAGFFVLKLSIDSVLDKCALFFWNQT